MKIMQYTMALLTIVASLALVAYAQDISPECATEPTDVTLSYGDGLVCAIEAAGDSDIFRFSGNIGDRVIIEAERLTGNLTFICQELIAPNGETLANTCEAEKSTRIDIVLSQAGIHTIVVNDELDNRVGNYAISISCIGACTGPPPPTGIMVDPTRVDFDTVSIDMLSTPQTITITNDGTAVLEVSQLFLDGSNPAQFGLLNDTCSRQSLSPNSQCTVKGVFAPILLGSQSAQLSIPSNDPDTPAIVAFAGVAEEGSSPGGKVDLIGVTPDQFTLRGGIFRAAISPRDQDDNLLIGGFGIEDFRFKDIRIALASNPGTPVTQGNAEVIDVNNIEGPLDASLTLVFTIDSTGSMQTNDPDRLRVDAGKALVAQLAAQDRAAITDFAFRFPNSANPPPDENLRVSRVLQEFTGDKQLLRDAVDLVIDNGGGTPLYGAVLDSLDLLALEEGTNPAVVILTDGANTREDFTLPEAIDRAQQLEVPIFTVGLGQNLDFTDLQSLARETIGIFAEATTAENLTPILEALGRGITEGRIVVSGEGTFNPPLQQAGTYQVSGVLETMLEGGAVETPFMFTVEINAQ